MSRSSQKIPQKYSHRSHEVKPSPTTPILSTHQTSSMKLKNQPEQKILNIHTIPNNIEHHEQQREKSCTYNTISAKFILFLMNILTHNLHGVDGNEKVSRKVIRIIFWVE